VSGARLWREVLGGYELEEHELAVLREAVKTVDLCDKLGAIVDKEGRPYFLTITPMAEMYGQAHLVQWRCRVLPSKSTSVRRPAMR
jgi:hypothetical protein